MISFTNPIVWVAIAALGVLVLVALVYFIWRYTSKDPYSIGYRKGKKIVGIMREQLLSTLNSKASKKSFDERLKEVCERVFGVGFAFERSQHELDVKDIEFQIRRVEEELTTSKKALIGGYDSEIKIAKSEEPILRKRIEELEAEWMDTQKKEAEKLQQLQEQEVRGGYFMSELASNLKSLLKVSSKKFETEILGYGYAALVALLLAGDFYITYSIFNDILKISVRNSAAIYIFSGTIALVFLVLAEFFLEFIESQSSKNAELIELVQKYSISIIGAILLVAYILIISVSLFPENNASHVIDAILRILFLPLITAAALMVRRICKDFGFNFLLVPFEFVIFSIGLILSYIILPFEIFAISAYSRIKFKRRLTPIENNIQSTLGQTRQKLLELEQGVAGLEQKILSSKAHLESEVIRVTFPLKQKKEEIAMHFKALKRGSDEAVYTQLRQA